MFGIFDSNARVCCRSSLASFQTELILFYGTIHRNICHIRQKKRRFTQTPPVRYMQYICSERLKMQVLLDTKLYSNAEFFCHFFDFSFLADVTIGAEASGQAAGVEWVS